MADKCPHCGVEVGPLATKCYKCGGPIDKEQQMMQDGPSSLERGKSDKYFLFSIIFGVLGIVLCPYVWMIIAQVLMNSGQFCGMNLFSAIFGLLAFVMGAVMIKNKDKRGFIGLILGIITGVILILLPFVWVMITPFGGY